VHARQKPKDVEASLPYPSGSPGKRCYAIGDVHGRLDLLTRLLEGICQHNAARPPRSTSVVLLGDLIDRGPDSRGVVEYLRTVRLPDISLFVIAGNHEELMLRALSGDESGFQSWIRNGGKATAQSYGVDIDTAEGIDFGGIQGRLSEAIPHSHLAFLRSCADSVGFGDYLLVHAGVRPGIPLRDQQPKDLRWIRNPFLTSAIDHGRVIIHGHSISLEIEQQPNRIGIDTGAYQTGLLTTIWLEDDRRGFLQVSAAPDESHNG
jgi:serine/threonine protein phosphatase 1